MQVHVQHIRTGMPQGRVQTFHRLRVHSKALSEQRRLSKQNRTKSLACEQQQIYTRKLAYRLYQNASLHKHRSRDCKTVSVKTEALDAEKMTRA